MIFGASFCRQLLHQKPRSGFMIFRPPFEIQEFPSRGIAGYNAARFLNEL